MKVKHGSNTNDTLITDLLTELKKSARLSDLCYYYLALNYCFNPNLENMDRVFCTKVGYEMMYALKSIDNPYAHGYFRALQESKLNSSDNQGIKYYYAYHID